MIGDNEIHAQPLRGLRRREGANAHVHADDEANSRSGCALDHIVAQIVALTNTVRDMKIRRASAKFDGSLQDDDRHRSIHVVIAIDQDGFLAFDSGIQTVDGGAQASHQLGCMQVSERRSEEARSGVSICQAAANKQLRQRTKGSVPTYAIGPWNAVAKWKTGQIAKGRSQALRSNWIFSRRFPAHG
jgi:hypothetical protein